MRNLFLASAAALALAGGATMVSAQSPAGDPVVAQGAMSAQQKAAYATWPADKKASYDKWPVEYQAYFWSLSASQQTGWFALTDAQRKQVYDMPPASRAQAWVSIEQQLAGGPPPSASAAPPSASTMPSPEAAAAPPATDDPASAPAQVQANPVGSAQAADPSPDPATANSSVAPSMPADPGYNAGPYKGALTAPPADAQELGIDFVEALRPVLLRLRRRVVDDVLEVDRGMVHARPRGLAHREPVPIGGEAPFEHERRLVLLRRDLADHVLGEAVRNRVGLDVGDEAVLILAGDEVVELRCRRAHVGSLPSVHAAGRALRFSVSTGTSCGIGFVICSSDTRDSASSTMWLMLRQFARTVQAASCVQTPGVVLHSVIPIGPSIASMICAIEMCEGSPQSRYPPCAPREDVTRPLRASVFRILLTVGVARPIRLATSAALCNRSGSRAIEAITTVP
jgi:hypothetical protein